MKHILLLLSACLLLTGCMSDAIFCISLHKISTKESFAPESLLVRTATDVSGDNAGDITPFPIVDSSSFGSVQYVKGDNDKWGLRLRMDRRGLGLWRQATAQYQGGRIAVLIDGFYAGDFVIKEYDPSGFVIIPPLWSKDEARQIAEHVKKNYDILNKKVIP